MNKSINEWIREKKDGDEVENRTTQLLISDDEEVKIANIQLIQTLKKM